MVRLIISLGLLFAIPTWGVADTISYVVSPRSHDDRVSLEVTMSFTGHASGKTRLELPTGRFGTPEIWRSTKFIDVTGATVETKAPKFRILTHPPSQPIELTYEVSRDPAADEGYAYSPSTSSDHFHFFGPQWRVSLSGRTELNTYQLEFKNVPDDWVTFSNFGHGAGPFERDSQDLSGFIAGGKYRSTEFEVNGIPVGVYAYESFPDSERMVKATRAIIERQGELFGGFQGDFYLVSITPRADIRAGTAIDNAFVCFTDPETNKVDFDVLIAHEVFHNWLPKTGTIDCWRDGTEVDEFRLDWFVEGFTEYVARRMLLDSGRIEHREFVDRFNQDLREQARNPARRASLEVVKQALKDNKFTNYHERTSYFRGPLIALKWDTLLRKKGDITVIDIVQSFVRQASEDGGTMNEEAFYQLFENHGISIREDYRRHIVYGEPPTLPEGIFGSTYSAEPVTIRRYSHGFDALSSRKTKIIQGVRLDSPAYNAGLRDGMILIAATLAQSDNERSKVIVAEDQGRENAQRTLQFSPTPIDVKTVRFVAIE